MLFHRLHKLHEELIFASHNLGLSLLSSDPCEILEDVALHDAEIGFRHLFLIKVCLVKQLLFQCLVQGNVFFQLIRRRLMDWMLLQLVAKFYACLDIAYKLDEIGRDGDDDVFARFERLPPLSEGRCLNARPH